MPCPNHRNPGFTLIEILIVMVIISVASGIALVTITGNRHKQLETFAYKLSYLITLAEEKAMLQPATLGLGLTPTSFTFYKFQPSTTQDRSVWQPYDDSNFGSRTIPSNVHLTLKIHNKTIQDDENPHIIISESGDITPFSILISKTGEAPLYKVSSDGSSKIKTEMIHEE